MNGSGPVTAITVLAFAATLGVVAGGQTPSPAGAPMRTFIRNARLIDGSGSPARIGDVRIAGDRIVAVGQLSPVADERIYDAGGLALAPGFIDTHSHHDRGLESARDAAPMVSQGVTTIVVGQDGGGIDLAALFARLARQPAAVNVGSYAGHGAIRESRDEEGLRPRGDRGGVEADGGVARDRDGRAARWGCPPVSSTTPGSIRPGRKCSGWRSCRDGRRGLRESHPK